MLSNCTKLNKYQSPNVLEALALNLPALALKLHTKHWRSSLLPPLWVGVKQTKGWGNDWGKFNRRNEPKDPEATWNLQGCKHRTILLFSVPDFFQLAIIPSNLSQCRRTDTCVLRSGSLSQLGIQRVHYCSENTRAENLRFMFLN